MSKPANLADAWKQYRDAMYPTGIGATQNQECCQAFMAGAGIAFLLIKDAGLEEDETKGCARLTALETEISEYAKARIDWALAKGAN